MFEYDPGKSRANLDKHGIDFEQAQTLWRDPDGLDVPSKFPQETRRLWMAARGGQAVDGDLHGAGRQRQDHQRAAVTRKRTERVQ